MAGEDQRTLETRITEAAREGIEHGHAAQAERDRLDALETDTRAALEAARNANETARLASDTAARVAAARETEHEEVSQWQKTLTSEISALRADLSRNISSPFNSTSERPPPETTEIVQVEMEPPPPLPAGGDGGGATPSRGNSWILAKHRRQ